MKKFLSMVLALAMAMSLVTFAAPAAGAYTDDDSITYNEAVDVISAIKIMDGYGDASFNPSGTLTRGAASKIICNMILGPTTASALPTNVAPFPDVAAGSTFAGYIAYCAEHNIISGYADGNFRPADSLSGYAFLKMLLCALGYDQDIEGYKGANWRVNVAKQALGIGLDDGLATELDGSRIVTREEAALYAFNTLQSDLVEYGNKTTVAVNGATVTVGGNTYHSKTAGSQRAEYRNIDVATATDLGNNIVQFAEEYFPQLERWPKNHSGVAGGVGDFGEPQTRWEYKNVEIGKYGDNLTKTYYGDQKVSTIYADLGMSGSDDNAEVYLNGYPVFDVKIERSNGDKLGEADLAAGQNGASPVAGYASGQAYYKDKVGDGTIINVYYDEEDNEVTICAASVYVGEIDSTHAGTSTRDAYVVINEKKANATEIGNQFAKSGNDEFETDEAFIEDDIVWFTYSGNATAFGEVHKMDSVEGILNRRVNGKSMTLDSVKYDFGKEYTMDGFPENDLANTSSYIVYRDGQGYVLFVEESDFAVAQYALIERISIEKTDGNIVSSGLTGGVNTGVFGVWGEEARVRLLLSDGTERNFELDESKRYRTAVNTVSATYAAGQVIRYNEVSDGVVRLYAAGAMPGATTGTVKTANTVNNGAQQFGIKTRAMNNLFREVTDATTLAVTKTRVEADSDTLFVVKDPDGIKTYTGVRNAPDVVVTGANTVYAYAYISSGKNPTAKLVFVIVSSSNDVTTSSKDITFLTNPSDKYESDTGDAYYEYTAIIKGVIQSDPVYVYETAELRGSKGDTSEDVGTYNDGNAPSVVAGSDYKTGSIILNTTKYDNEDFLTSGTYASKTIRSMVAQGIKKTGKSDEIKLGTHDNEITYTVTSNVSVFYIDDDGVAAEIALSDISNDTEDMVYFTLDDGDVTNIFIVDYEDDDVYIANAYFAGGVIKFNWNTTDAAEKATNDATIAGKKPGVWGTAVANALNMQNDGYVKSAMYNAATGKIDVITGYDGNGKAVIDSYSVPTAADSVLVTAD